MRRSSVLLAVAALGFLVAPASQPAAKASCTGPYLLDADRLVLARGTTTTVEGRGFVAGCRDSMGCEVGPGCDDCDYDEPPATPYDDVRLGLVQGGRTWTLATADAGSAADDRLGWVTWTFDVPAGVRPGRARLVADHGGPVLIRIR